MSDEVSNEVPESSETLQPVESVELPPQESTPAEVAPLEQSAQIPANEPMVPEPIKTEPEVSKIEEVITVEKQSPTSILSTLLVKARSVIQFRKRKKLEKIMSLFIKNQSISNDQVEKLLHVSDATATRYLSILEKEGKIRKSTPKGSKTSYIKI